MLAIPNAVHNLPLLAMFPDCSRAGTGFLEETHKLSPAISMPRRPANKKEL